MITISSDNKQEANGSGIVLATGIGVALGAIYDNITFGIIFGIISGLFLDAVFFNKKN